MKEIRRICRNGSRSMIRLSKPTPKLEVQHPEVQVPQVITLPGTPSSQLGHSISTEKYPQLYDVAPIAFFTLDHSARICELNAKGAVLLGFAAHWLIGKSFVVFVAREDVQPFLNFLRESIRTKVHRTLEIDLF